MKRVGHLGTLDPGAAGVLPVSLGRATRLFDLLVDKEKEYIAEIAFGACTDTQDSYGLVTRRGDVRVEPEQLTQTLALFLGEQTQIAPKYSALKSGGKALYQLARSGQDVPERVRPVTFHALELLDRTDESRYLIRVRCSRGTYIRTLCEDIGARLGACAHLSFLLRTASGPFRVEDSFSIAELAALKESGELESAVVSVEAALSFLPRVSVGEEDAQRLRNGCCVQTDAPKGTCLIYGAELLGVGAAAQEGLKLRIHLWQRDSE